MTLISSIFYFLSLYYCIRSILSLILRSYEISFQIVCNCLLKSRYKVIIINSINLLIKFLMTYLQQKPNISRFNPQSYKGDINAAYSFDKDQQIRNSSNQAIKFQPNRFVESQVNQVYKPIRPFNEENNNLKPIPLVHAQATSQVPIFNHQPTSVSVPVKSPLNRQSSSKTYNTTGLTITDKRYSTYLKQSEASVYKYNIFSFLDEPWNNCLQDNECGSCPSNECLPRQIVKQYWN